MSRKLREVWGRYFVEFDDESDSFLFVQVMGLQDYKRKKRKLKQKMFVSYFFPHWWIVLFRCTQFEFNGPMLREVQPKTRIHKQADMHRQERSHSTLWGRLLLLLFLTHVTPHHIILWYQLLYVYVSLLSVYRERKPHFQCLISSAKGIGQLTCSNLYEHYWKK